MKKTALISLALLTSALTATADNKQIVTVHGQQTDKTVKKLTFMSERVVLTFSDNTTDTVDMDNVSIVFTVADAVKALATEAEGSICYFDLGGRQLTKAPDNGSYIMKKGKKVVKLIRK